MNEPATSSSPCSAVLGAHDALNEYIQHIGSGVFAVPPGLAAGQDWGRQLFG